MQGYQGFSSLMGRCGECLPPGQRLLQVEFKLAKSLEDSSTDVNLC